MRQRLTDQFVREAPAPAKGNHIVYDAPNKRGNDYVPGFGLRVTAGDARAFVLNYRAKGGQERRHTIGRYPAWTVQAARDEAKKLKRAIDGGGDPVAQSRELRGAPVVADLCRRFAEEHLPRRRPSTQKDYAGILRVIEAELGNRKVASISFEHIDRLHRRLTRESGPYRANRVLAVASKMFALAIRWKMRADNPCKGVERNDEVARKRYLSGDELARLTAALDASPNRQAANAVRLLLLSGARCGETFAATWDQFDLQAGKWTKPARLTKQRADHTIPLSPPACELLRRIRSGQDEAERFVFPSPRGPGHIVHFKRQWAAICAKAGIENLRIHDLRHSYASMAISAGWSLPVVGALLGHTLPSTTQRYAHLVDDVLKRATATVGAVVTGKKAPVVPLRRGRQ
jgi:integrase